MTCITSNPGNGGGQPGGRWAGLVVYSFHRQTPVSREVRRRGEDLSHNLLAFYETDLEICCSEFEILQCTGTPWFMLFSFACLLSSDL